MGQGARNSKANESERENKDATRSSHYSQNC